MARYHMKKDGTPGICNAQPGNCPLGGNENHVEAETLEQAQQQFDRKNEHIVELNEDLLNDYDSYSREEKEVFDKMYWSGIQGTYIIDYDELPENIKEDLLTNSGNTEQDLKDMDIIVEHTDSLYTGSLASEYLQEVNPEVEELLNEYSEKIDDDVTLSDILRDNKAGKKRQEKAMKALKEYVNTSTDYEYKSSFSENGAISVMRKLKSPSRQERLEQIKSLDEYNAEEYLTSIFKEAFDEEPENAYSFSEQADWDYEKDGIKVEWSVETYFGEDYNSLDISDNGELLRSFRFYPDDYNGETFERIVDVDQMGI